MATLAPLYIEGLGFWTPRARDWPSAAAALRPGAPLPDLPQPLPRPAPDALPPNERRRAPDAVLIALDVALQAQRMSGRAASELASVFTSAHGDLAIVDALCSTLATNPLALSPMRFHHSVHNAPSGYWAIASGSHAGSNALAGYEHSFGVGLLEAAALALADGRPVLLAGADTEARGAMLSVNTSRGLLGAALVLAPARSAAAQCRLDLEIRPLRGGRTPGCSALATRLADNALSDALPLFEALAAVAGAASATDAAAAEPSIHLPVGPASTLAITVHPLT
jgi:hypothetical protein